MNCRILTEDLISSVLKWPSLILLVSSIFLLFMTCKDDDMANGGGSNTNDAEEPQGIENYNGFVHNFFIDNDFIFERDRDSDIDRVKIALSLSLSNMVLSDIDESSLRETIRSQEKNRIMAVDFNSITLNGENLLDLLLDNLDEADRDIENTIENICSIYPHLSIGLPMWVGELPTEVLSDSEWVVFPAVRIRSDGFWRGKRLSDGDIIAQGYTKTFEFIPLQVKEVEDLIPYRESDLSTIYGDLLIDDHFPILNVCENELSSLSDFSVTFPCDAEFRYLDIVAFRDYLRGTCFLSAVEICGNGIDDDGDGAIDFADSDCSGVTPFEICDNGIDDDGDNMIDEADTDCQCVQTCERDCNKEINTVEGISLTNGATYYNLNNQPGGEDNVSFHYTFVASTLCGDPNMSAICEASTWKKIYYGTFFEFFEMSEIVGATNSVVGSVALFIDKENDRLWQIKPKQFSLPAFNSEEPVYANASYLDTSPNGHFDGNLYGNVISINIHEHDNAIVDDIFPLDKAISNASSVPYSLQSPDVNLNQDDSFTSFGFSNILKISEHTYRLNLLQDADFAQTASLYCDPNFTNPSIGFGINKSTGSVNTKLAFY